MFYVSQFFVQYVIIVIFNRPFLKKKKKKYRLNEYGGICRRMNTFIWYLNVIANRFSGANSPLELEPNYPARPLREIFPQKSSFS